MSNYNQLNIYRKQMIKLGLNTKEYAQLINMPYEVVKDIIYDKKGDYSMDIKNILRKNMFEKHEEIENDIENARLKGNEIKMNNDVMKWYREEYTPELSKEKFGLSSLAQFERSFEITIDGKRASHWFYTAILPKKYLNKVDNDVISEFVEQLYDILVNENLDKYKKDVTRIQQIKIKRITDNKYLDWYKNFDKEEFFEKYNLDNEKIAHDLKMAYSSACSLTSGKYMSLNGIKQFYKYVEKLEREYTTKNVVNEIIEDVKDTFKDEPLEVKVEATTEEPIIIDMKEDVDMKEEQNPVNIYNENVQDEILRKLLINRLTDEEKELIRIFGGKLD